MKTSKIPTPPKDGKYNCKVVRGKIVQFEVYCGRTWIGSLMNYPGSDGWGVAETMFVRESPSSRLTSKQDMLYFIACIDFLNEHALYLREHD
jgi:hypothetical protein